MYRDKDKQTQALPLKEDFRQVPAQVIGQVLSPCSLEDLSCYVGRHLSEALLKRQCLCLFTFVPSRKSPLMRQLADKRDV